MATFVLVHGVTDPDDVAWMDDNLTITEPGLVTDALLQIAATS